MYIWIKPFTNALKGRFKRSELVSIYLILGSGFPKLNKFWSINCCRVSSGLSHESCPINSSTSITVLTASSVGFVSELPLVSVIKIST